MVGGGDTWADIHWLHLARGWICHSHPTLQQIHTWLGWQVQVYFVPQSLEYMQTWIPWLHFPLLLTSGSACGWHLHVQLSPEIWSSLSTTTWTALNRAYSSQWRWNLTTGDCPFSMCIYATDDGNENDHLSMPISIIRALHYIKLHCIYVCTCSWALEQCTTTLSLPVLRCMIAWLPDPNGFIQ